MLTYIVQLFVARQFTTVDSLLSMYLSLSFTGRGGCRVEDCNRQYEPVEQSANIEYCRVLRNYAECIRETARGCRGNIKYHATAKIVEDNNEEYNCSYILSNEKNFQSVTRPPSPRNTASTICNYGSGRMEPLEYVHCGLFGDPHLTTFKNEFYTCKVVGAWPLISNEYLSVQTTNEPVALLDTSSATATTKVCICGILIKLQATSYMYAIVG